MSSFVESKADPNAPTTLTVAGYASSAEFQKAANVIAALEHLEPGKFKARILEFDGKAEYEAWLPNQRSQLGPASAALNGHTACPLVWRGDDEYIGDCEDALGLVRAEYMSGSARPAPRGPPWTFP